MAGPDLENLLRELSRTRSPIERVRLLSRGWRALSRLTPSERLLLAKHAGLERAEGILERLAQGRGRLTPSLLLQAVRRAKDVNPVKVGELVRRLRDPGQRAELLQKGLEESFEALSDPTGDGDAASEPEPEPEPAEVEELPPTEAPPKRAKRIEKPSRWSRPPPWLESTTVTASAAAAAAAAASAKKPEAEEAKSREPAATSKATVSEPSQSVSPTPGPVEPPAPTPPPVAKAPAPAAKPARIETEPPPPVVVAPPVPESSPESDLPQRLEATETTMKRLRLLRDRASELRGADIDRLRSAVEAFPDGWCRRRALSTLFRAGIPQDVHRAAFLIEQLGSPMARRWCASVLLDSRDLLPHERDALIERHRLFGRRPEGRRPGQAPSA